MRAFVVSVFMLRSFYAMDEPSISLQSSVTLLRPTHRVEVLDNIFAPFNSSGTRPPTSTWPHLRFNVGLEEGEYRENCLCLAILCSVYYYNGAQRYEQFLQFGQLYRAFILLSLALFRASLCLRSSWCYIYIIFFAYILLFTF